MATKEKAAHTYTDHEIEQISREQAIKEIKARASMMAAAAGMVWFAALAFMVATALGSVWGTVYLFRYLF